EGVFCKGLYCPLRWALHLRVSVLKFLRKRNTYCKRHNFCGLKFFRIGPKHKNLKLFAGSNFCGSNADSVVLTYCPNCSRDPFFVIRRRFAKLGPCENLVVYSTWDNSENPAYFKSKLKRFSKKVSRR
ncbi:MAG: hypothetical protein PV344_05430, partial [Anaplasma sp.]|nr:hypothetical protein [Anaplasma sp.]